MSSFISSLFRSKCSEGPRQMRFGLARIFSYKELRKATNNFDTIVGAGGFGRVYLGKLADGQTVAVKVLNETPRQLEKFLNEVTVFSQIRHKNLVTFYGCTDPICQELILVYEFMPNGTVSDHIHGPKPALTWAVRFQIAIQVAEGLAHLHARDPPIFHRDVKTSNILLDDAFNAKLAGFVTCRIAPWSTPNVSTAPQGTMGYIDPEYYHTFRLGDKSDVYSFGVVLVELISGQKVVDINRLMADNMDEIYLNDIFLSKVTNNKLDEIVDPKLEHHLDNNVRLMIKLVSELARQCLEPKGDGRLPMADVLDVLKEIEDRCNVLEEAGGVGV